MTKSPSHSPRIKARDSSSTLSAKSGLHPRNLHKFGYDFAKLIALSPNLTNYVKPNAFGNDSIDFSDPNAVKALNQALLKAHYAIDHWDIPEHYLCPPIPSRADYIHNLADLINKSAGNHVTQTIRVLDIGTGANMIYPLIGQRAYGWQFVGVDIDKKALINAQQIIENNHGLVDAISLRLQPSPTSIFNGLIQANDSFNLTMCNPPFHSSQAEAQAGTQRKWRNLGKTPQKNALNFGGHKAELYCEGGEAAFIRRMIMESVCHRRQVGWFTTLVSKADNLPKIYKILKDSRNKYLSILKLL